MPPPGRPCWSNAFQQLHVREPQQPLLARQLDDDVQPDQTEDDEQEEEVPRVSETGTTSSGPTTALPYQGAPRAVRGDNLTEPMRRGSVRANCQTQQSRRWPQRRSRGACSSILLHIWPRRKMGAEDHTVSRCRCENAEDATGSAVHSARRFSAPVQRPGGGLKSRPVPRAKGVGRQLLSTWRGVDRRCWIGRCCRGRFQSCSASAP